MQSSSDEVPLAAEAMLRRWKTRACRAMSRVSSPASSFTRKHDKGRDAEERTEEVPDNGQSLVHGAMRFPGSRLRPAKWARVSHETSMTDAMQLITRTWGLPTPSSLISIIGSNEHDPRPVHFGAGLRRAADTTNAWIVTDGVHAATRIVVVVVVATRGFNFHDRFCVTQQ